MAYFLAGHKRERLAAKESKPGNGDRHVTAACATREVIKQSAARELVTELGNAVAAQHRCVLHSGVAIVVVLGRGAGECVLPKVLVLGIHLDSSHVAGAQAEAEHEAVVLVDLMVETERVNIGSF